MKNKNCQLADARNLKDENWQRHAQGCQECRDVFLIAQWMTDLSDRTSMETILPAPGFLLAKARIRAKRSSAERAAIPIYAMVGLAAILLGVSTAVLFRTESRFAEVITNAFSMIASYSVLIVAGTFISGATFYAGSYMIRTKRI